MSKILRLTALAIVGIAVIGVALYAAGYRILGPTGQSIL